jgi:2-oxo-4-hydroxy-4-carboxy-5-ureidoimidazoline decarboxylase
MMTKKIRLDALLNLSEPEFLDLIGGIYENTPTIVQQFYNNHLHPERVSATSGRITNVKLLFDEIRRYVYEGLNGEERLGLLRAHPDLCAALLKKKKEEEEEVANNSNNELTAESRLEQRRSGLSSLTPEELAKFIRLNEQYKSKFNIPFILAVRNATKYTVLSAMERRVHSNYETEIATALAQVHNIAWMRLLAIVDPPLVVKDDGVQIDVGHGGFLTCHILDTANGVPAKGMHVELYRLEEDMNATNEGQEESRGHKNYQRTLMTSFRSNTDGRSGAPLLSGPEFAVGRYELSFYVGDYFASCGTGVAGTPFLDMVPVQFGIDDPTSHYHVPLLVSPWSYSTYRGS